ncbi:MAG: addiction module antitoxin, partial [Proteobacteria bacterium]|nr:addiction module antitoxin [Pseudomonadota bacterium]
LHEDKRPFAGLYGKVRQHSAALRNGICETLVLLSVHGNNLFRNPLGIDVETKVMLLVSKLLTPLTLEKLLSHDRDLPNYAEAAPEEFLRIIKNDLDSNRVVFELLTPADTGIFGAGCPRTGLLWALECLAWRPQNLPRVADILAQLSTKKIDDNWANKPENSLQSIFRSWMPQTAATVEQRIMTLEAIAKNFPDIVWAICVEQFDPGSRTGSSNYRPRWRSDASGAGQPVTRREDAQFIRRCVEIALAWPTHNERTLGDLVERLQALSDEHQTAVWDMIDAWASACSDEDKKAQLRDRIRRYAFTRRSRTGGITSENASRARQSSAMLSPADPVIRHEWLFRAQWVEESAEEIEHHDFDYRLREQRIHEQRTSALCEIWQQRKFEGLAKLLHRSGAPHIIGNIMADLIEGSRPVLEFVKYCIAGTTGEHASKYEHCLKGFLLKNPDPKGALPAAIETAFGRDGLTTLYLCMQFGSATWQEVEKKGLRQAYWSQVSTHWNNHEPDEANELIDRLVEVERPLAAFHAVHLDWTKVETSRLTKLLHAVATTGTEMPSSYKLRDYEVSEAFKTLDKRPGVSSEEKAQLEFLYLAALDHGEHGIPNIEKQIAISPSLFVHAVISTFKRNDGGTDPAEFVIEDPERRSAVAGATYRLLDRIRRVPGSDENGVINLSELKAWLTDVRTQLKKYGRAEIGDQCIGQVFSRTPVREGSTWPNRTICEAMEWMGSDEVGRGFHIGARNSRGVHWRGDDGAQERELAARYRNWADELAFEFPLVSGVLESVAASYDREAQWEDTDARIRKRLPYG